MFFERQEYLIWFSGKNLLEQFWTRWSLPGGKSSHWVTKYREEVHRLFALLPLPADLQQLQQRLQSL